eukprot:3937413-Rhodomonas_salina.2
MKRETWLPRVMVTWRLRSPIAPSADSQHSAPRRMKKKPMTKTTCLGGGEEIEDSPKHMDCDPEFAVHPQRDLTLEPLEGLT